VGVGGDDDLASLVSALKKWDDVSENYELSGCDTPSNLLSTMQLVFEVERCNALPKR
jgi:hypothetical protein